LNCKFPAIASNGQENLLRERERRLVGESVCNRRVCVCLHVLQSRIGKKHIGVKTFER
jgi:hypothetical protein